MRLTFSEEIVMRIEQISEIAEKVYPNLQWTCKLVLWEDRDYRICINHSEEEQDLTFTYHNSRNPTNVEFSLVKISKKGKRSCHAKNNRAYRLP